MKKLLAALLLSAAPAFADSNDISVDRPTNIFNTSISVSSSPFRAVRLGVSNSVPYVVLNVPGYAPVRLGNTAGALTYNGVAIATGAFVGTDMSVTNDLAVGRDAAITRNLSVTGTAAAATMNTGQGAYELYKMDQNVDTTASPSFVAATITGGKFALYNRTKAQLVAITPAALGEVYMCSDCTPKMMVVSTGTSAGNFASAAGTTFQ